MTKEQQLDKKLKEAFKLIEKANVSEFGKECDDYEETCVICEVHKALKVLRRNYFNE